MKKWLTTLIATACLFLITQINPALAAGETVLSLHNTLPIEGADKIFTSPDGKIAITGSSSWLTIPTYLWHLQSGIKKEIKEFSYDSIQDIAFSRDSTIFGIVSGGYSQNKSVVLLYNSQSGEVSEEISFNSRSGILSISFSSDGRYLSAGTSGGIEMVDLTTKEVTTVIPVHGNVAYVEFSPKNLDFASIILSSEEDMTPLLQIRDKNNEIIKSIDDVLPNGYSEFIDLKYSPEGNYLFVSYIKNGKGGSLILDARNGYNIAAKVKDFGKISFSSTGETVIVGDTVYSVNDEFRSSYTIKIKNNTQKLSKIHTILTSDEKYVLTMGKWNESLLVLDARTLKVNLVGIKIMPEISSLSQNEQIALQLIGIYSDRTEKPLPVDQVKWEVQDFYVAEINNFALRGNSPGQTRLLASYSGFTASTIVTVEDTSTINQPEYRDSKQIILKVNSPEMIVNGKSAPIDSERDTRPVIQNGRTLLPIASIIREFGGTVTWNEVDRKVTVLLGENQVELWINRNQAKVNGTTQVLDVAPTIINGKTMVPLRFVSDNIGVDLIWHGNNRVISLYYNESGETSFWFAGSNTEKLSNTLGRYVDGVSYTVNYPLTWGDPYVIKNAYSANQVEHSYDYKTIFYDSNEARVTGEVDALRVVNNGNYELAYEYMIRTGRETGQRVNNGQLYQMEVEDTEHPDADSTYIVVVTQTDQRTMYVINEILFFKGAYVVIIKFEGAVDYKEFIEADASVIPQFNTFLETIIGSFKFLEGAGAAG